MLVPRQIRQQQAIRQSGEMVMQLRDAPFSRSACLRALMSRTMMADPVNWPSRFTNR